jgi:hypothetical protein
MVQWGGRKKTQSIIGVTFFARGENTMLGYRGLFRSLLLVAAIPLLLVAGSGPSNAFSTTWNWVEFNVDPSDVTYIGTVTMSDDGLADDQISFKFETDSSTPPNGALSVAYWDANYEPLTEFAIFQDTSATGWAFDAPPPNKVTPGDPPGVPVSWTDTTQLAGAKGSTDAIRAGEMVTVVFGNFGALGYTIEEIAALVESMASGWFVAGHILDCTAEGSCTAIAAPIPAALWLFLSAILGLVGIGRRRQRMVATA